MENYLKSTEIELVEMLSNEELISIDGGIEKWMVYAAFCWGAGPGLIALGYYNATH